MGSSGETLPVSVPWAQVLWSILNYFFEVGPGLLLSSGLLGWPPLGLILPVENPGLGLRSKVKAGVLCALCASACWHLYNRVSFGDGGRRLGELQRPTCTHPLQRPKGGAPRHLPNSGKGRAK